MPQHFPGLQLSAVAWNHPHLGVEDFRLHKFLMAHFFPAARVLMVDADPKIKLPHLACLPTVEHHLLDVQSAEAFDLVRGAVRDATRACIVVGVHLCGDLSRRAVRLFLSTNARALVLCPCCLPRRRRHDVFGFHVVDQARCLKREPHGVWCMALHGLLPWRDRETFAVDARVDDDVEGPFKTFLVARRKKKTNEPSPSRRLCLIFSSTARCARRTACAPRVSRETRRA